MKGKRVYFFKAELSSSCLYFGATGEIAAQEHAKEQAKGDGVIRVYRVNKRDMPEGKLWEDRKQEPRN